MSTSSAPNPADLRMILGDNLRQLTQNVGSISELCRAIGINRTQFNRYLNGMAFPRPDVLFRICHHFGVDANIMLYRLDSAPPPPPAPTGQIVIDTHRPFDHYLLPDGIYHYWRKSFRQPGRAYAGMARIHTANGAKIWKGYDIHDAPIRPGGLRYARSSDYEGQLVQQFDGFALMSATPYTDQMNVTFFEYGLDARPDYYSGISFVTRRRLAEANRLTAIVMYRLPDNFGAWLRAARSCGSTEITSLSPEIQTALNRVPDKI